RDPHLRAQRLGDVLYQRGRPDHRLDGDQGAPGLAGADALDRRGQEARRHRPGHREAGPAHGHLAARTHPRHRQKPTMSRIPGAAGRGAPDAADDIRLELAAAAAASERRNRPLLFVAGAALLLVVTAIYAISDAYALASARGAIGEERESGQAIEALAGQLK